MTDRRVRRRRRLTGWLVAALVGAASAIATVTPAQAATTCAVTFRVNAWGTVDGRARWLVDATMANTGSANSKNWQAFIVFPTSAGAVVRQYWNVTRDRAYVWNAAAWNAVILPGKTTNFGFEVETPNWTVSPSPLSSGCSITY